MANTQRLFVCSATPDDTLTDWQRERRDGPILPMEAVRSTRKSDWTAGAACVGGVALFLTVWSMFG